MEITRTYDREFITQCMTEEKCWEACSDDGACDPLLYFPIMDESVYWLRYGDYGVFMFHQHNLITYEVHTILPYARGKAINAAIESGIWMIENTPCERIITNVPSFNKLALRLSIKAGMTEYGVNKESFKKNGVNYDQILFGITKNEILAVEEIRNES